MSPLLLALGTYAVTLIEMGRLLASSRRYPARALPGSGRVDAFGGAYLATTFVQLGGLPLLPVESRLFLEEPSGSGDGAAAHAQDVGALVGFETSVPVPLDRRSVAAAYLRWYGTTLGFIAVLRLLALVGVAPAAGIYALLPVPLILPSLLAAAAGWLWLGRLSRDEKAKRVVYWDYTGHFVDPALLGGARLALREKLAREVALQASALTGTSYRQGFDPDHAWRRLAATPRAPRDPVRSDDKQEARGEVAFRRAALTLSRVEWSLARGSERRTRADESAVIWANLKSAQPRLLDEVDAYSLR